MTPALLRPRSLAFSLCLLATSAGHASSPDDVFEETTPSRPRTVYRIDFDEVKNITLPGWVRVGGYGDAPINVFDEGNRTATGKPALFLDSHAWDPQDLRTGTDTEIYGHTRVPYVPNTVYRVALDLHRRGTGANIDKNIEDESPFFGRLTVRLYAGEPREGGLLLGEAVSPPNPSPEVGPERILLTSLAQSAGSGDLYLVIATERVYASAPQAPEAYQQAEISLVAIQAHSGPGTRVSTPALVVP
jgi:hypothetical protein